MSSIEVLSRTQRIVVTSKPIVTVKQGPQRIIISSLRSVSVINAGPIGPPGVQGVQGPEGPEGPEGPQGPSGLDALYYLHDQTVASATWVVVHELGLYPNVTTVDTAGTTIQGGVRYDSPNQLTITFTEPQSGQAFVS